MVEVCSGSPPLYNMGGGSPHENSNLIPGIPSDALPGWYLSCDKLRLKWTTSVDCIPDDLLGGRFGPWRRQRNFGNQTVHARKAWILDGAVLFIHERRSAMISGETLLVEFNPNRIGWVGCHIVGESIRRSGFDPAAGVVERFDYCWTAEEDPYGLLIDSRHSEVDRIGVTSQGAKTERIGYRKGSKRKLQRYDKSAEARNRGVDAPDGIMRVEFTNWGVVKPGTEDDPQQLTFADLEGVDWPAPAHYRVLRRKRSAEDFADELWKLLATAAQIADAKQVRAWARKLLKGRHAERAAQAEMMLYDDLTPDLRRCFASNWRHVVRSIGGHLATGRQAIADRIPRSVLEELQAVPVIDFGDRDG